MKRLKRLTRKKYRITALVLALCMTLSLLPISALAAGTDLAGKAIEEGTFCCYRRKCELPDRRRGDCDYRR